jgi:hypothetical protein
MLLLTALQGSRIGEMGLRYSDFVSLLVRRGIVLEELKNVHCVPVSELKAPGITSSILKVQAYRHRCRSMVRGRIFGHEARH